MRADAYARMAEAVTIVHLDGETWRSQVLNGCAWQVRRVRYVGADGMASEQDSLMVQVPGDAGDVEVAQGDWLVRGEFPFEGDALELADAIPEGSRRVGTIRDLRGGITGIGTGVERFASALVLEAL